MLTSMNRLTRYHMPRLLQLMSWLVMLSVTAYGQLAEEQAALSLPSIKDELTASDSAEAGEGSSKGQEAFPEAPQTADEGIQVRVGKLTDSSGNTNESETIKIYSPYPAKPRSAAPEGWHYVPAPYAIKAYKQTVSLVGGNTIDLAVTPFVLVPSSDDAKIFSISEPGYNPSMKFSQQETIAAMLQAATMEIEKQEKQAAKAIHLLEQLLATLPQKNNE